MMLCPDGLQNLGPAGYRKNDDFAWSLCEKVQPCFVPSNTQNLVLPPNKAGLDTATWNTGMFSTLRYATGAEIL